MGTSFFLPCSRPAVFYETTRRNTNSPTMLKPHLFSNPTPGLITVTFDRHYGISDTPFASLNCSFSVGDNPDRVHSNRTAMKQALGIKRLISARQVHGDCIHTIEKTPEFDEEKNGVDALMTHKREVGLMIQHADCQAILLHDPVKSVIAAVHCGWRGSVLGIIGKTVRAMTSSYHSCPHDIHAGISPALGPCCAEFINHRQEFPSSFHPFQTSDNHFDFWQISHSQLIEVGLLPKNIQSSTICTSCNHNFFSYRRARRTGNGITGRNGSIISLKNSKENTLS